MEKIRFIHAADLHLGSTFPHTDGAKSFIKEEFERSIEYAVERMIQDAIQFQVDFIILAGDIFDQENRSIRSQIFLKRTFQQLQDVGIQVYMVFGNHDPLHQKYAFDTWPQHVHVFATTPEVKVFYKNNLPVCHLYGCSYKTRHVKENLAALYEKKEGALYHIAILHGQDRMSEEHVPYAPFSKNELLHKEMDYWALGHIHQRTSLHERIHYPGNIQGRHANETNQKGYLLVELDDDQIEVAFQAVSPIVFKDIFIPLAAEDTLDRLTEHLLEELRVHRNKAMKGIAARVILEEASSSFSDLFQREALEEFRETLNDIGATEDPFFYIYQMDNKPKKSFAIPEEKENTFLKDLHLQANALYQDAKEMDVYLRELFDHPVVKKHIPLENLDKKTLVEKGTQMIHYLWEKE
ncbi:exonuclease SbcCD subunit D [Aliibacillus thermotolerans]|uniref:Exonuclease SbcCD subunit D n=1 Tax=Aliibacillus thermotolerans TaxID=1834418 RepID=A0ABW0U5J2_9BACI|nr:DNA repair exonuclease [Aliibacillus thermotolerans]